MRTIKLLLGVIIALLVVVIVEMAKIITLLCGPGATFGDLGIPIMGIVGVGTIVVLVSNMSRKATLHEND